MADQIQDVWDFFNNRSHRWMVTQLPLMISSLLAEIKNKYHLPYKEIGHLTGVTPQYMSMLLNEKKIPSYHFVQLLRIIHKHPEILDEIKSEKFGIQKCRLP